MNKMKCITFVISSTLICKTIFDNLCKVRIYKFIFDNLCKVMTIYASTM